MPENHDTGYQVGFGKPPEQSQFRKGVSGNPGGRPKGSRNSVSILQDILQEKTTIEENGKRRRVTKDEAMWRSLVNRAISGDIAAITRVVELARAQEFKDPQEPLKRIVTQEGVLVPQAILCRRLLRAIERICGVKIGDGQISYVVTTEKQLEKMVKEITSIYGFRPTEEEAIKMANTSIMVKETEEAQANPTV